MKEGPSAIASTSYRDATLYTNQALQSSEAKLRVDMYNNVGINTCMFVLANFCALQKTRDCCLHNS